MEREGVAVASSLAEEARRFAGQLIAAMLDHVSEERQAEATAAVFEQLDALEARFTEGEAGLTGEDAREVLRAALANVLDAYRDDTHDR